MARLLGRPRWFRFPWRTAAQIEREVGDELDSHIEMLAADLVDRGLDPLAAQEEARRQFGDLETARWTLAAAGRLAETRHRRRNMLEELWQDTRYAWRSLLKAPGFTAVALVVLALGIGVNAAMFNLVNILALRPILIENPEELVGIYSPSTERPDSYRSFSYPLYRDLVEQSQMFSEIAAHNVTIVGITEGELTRRVMAGIVSANYFETFGVPPFRGRSFSLAEEAPDAEVPVVVVSHDFWIRQGQDPDFLGKTLMINGQQSTVIGIATPGFTGSTALFSPDVWLPLGLYGSLSDPLGSPSVRRLGDRSNYTLMVFGRLAPGVTPADTSRELEALAARLAETYPDTSGKQTLEIAPLPRLSISTEPERGDFLIAPIAMILAMSGVVLLIACLNLANMFLARGASRRTEVAIRVSLGGGRARLLRQLLTEGLLLSLFGGALGLALAYGAVKLLFSSLGSLLPFGITLLLDVRPDFRVVLATLVFCVLATLIFGLGPAWRLTGVDVVPGLKETPGEAKGKDGRRALAPRNLLIVGQIALSLVLLVAGGLFIRGALAAAEATPGFSLEHSLRVELNPSLVGLDEARGRDIYRHVLDRFRALPGVEAASLASIVPFGPVTSSRRVHEPGTSSASEDTVSANRNVIGNDYFETLRLPILRGRDFTAVEATDSSGQRVAIINEPLARLLWPDQDALGRQIETVSSEPGVDPATFEIVGIVPGLRHQFFDQAPTPHLYLPVGQHYVSNLHVHVRLAAGRSDEATMLQTLREEIRRIDPALPVLALQTMRDFRDQSLFLWAVKSAAKVFTVLGALALFLALVGVYGVKAFVTQKRTREIGIRMALGATPTDVLRLILREGAALTLAGLVLGLVLAFATARLLSSLLYQVSPSDPAVFASAALLLAGAATFAAYLPARRATRVPPTTALRSD